MFNKKYYIIFIILYIFTIGNLRANLSINITGGTDKISLSIAKIEADNLDNLNLAYDIEGLIKSQLEASKIFKIYNEFDNSKKDFSFLANLLNKFKKNLVTDKLFFNLSNNPDNSLKIEFFIQTPIEKNLSVKQIDNKILKKIRNPS